MPLLLRAQTAVYESNAQTAASLYTQAIVALNEEVEVQKALLTPMPL
jgi:hypothetical protein